MAADHRMRIRLASELTRAHLAEFRPHLAGLPKQTSKVGSPRGRKSEIGAKRSPVTVNRELRPMKTILNSLRRQGRLPQLDSDAIADSLGSLRFQRNDPSHLRPSEIQRLVEASARHDAETFSETRGEHAGCGTPASTPRYRPIMPVTGLLLFTGMRRGAGGALG